MPNPPATRTLVRDDLTPVVAYAALRAAHRGPSFLLESVVAGERWGRYSILGYRPKRLIELPADQGDALKILAEQLPPFERFRSPSVAARFGSSHVGVFFYDLVHTLGPIEPPEPLGHVAKLMGDATVVVFDHLSQTIEVAAPDQAALEQVLADLEAPVSLRRLAPPKPSATPEDLSVSIDDPGFCRQVERVKEYIGQGDIFQAVIARRFSVPTSGRDPLDVYRALRVLSPSPYMYMVDFPAQDEGADDGFTVVGASPETLVRLEDDKVYLRPIAGTRPRGSSSAHDDALAQEMLADPKERAEHVMLIDLARNDIGRVCKVGSVELPYRMEVERFSHVMHIVSEVVGEKQPELGPWDVLRSAFPAGTLSGAPKVRAMQIIAEMERQKRGIYGGAVGYLDGQGNMDLAIAIRTLLFREGRIEVTAGAGVVEGSRPQAEADETRNKARAALAAIAAVPPPAASQA